MPDHVHTLISKFSGRGDRTRVLSFQIIAQNVERKLLNFLGRKFWVRGYYVSSVGRDGEMIRASTY